MDCVVVTDMAFIALVDDLYSSKAWPVDFIYGIYMPPPQRPDLGNSWYLTHPFLLIIWNIYLLLRN